MKTIRQLRTEAKLSQLALANKVGVTPSAVFKWETGDTVPDIRRLRSLAKVFGVLIEDIALVGVDVDRDGNPLDETEG